MAALETFECKLLDDFFMINKTVKCGHTQHVHFLNVEIHVFISTTSMALKAPDCCSCLSIYLSGAYQQSFDVPTILRWSNVRRPLSFSVDHMLHFSETDQKPIRYNYLQNVSRPLSFSWRSQIYPKSWALFYGDHSM